MQSESELAALARGVLAPGFVGTSVPGWLADELGRGLAGAWLFGHNRPTEGFAALTGGLRAIAPTVLVCSDEEGGSVTRFEPDGSSWPGAHALGLVDDPVRTEAVAAELGAALRGEGIDLTAAPDVDVNSDPDNPVIGVRAFGDDPELVARHGAAFVRGLHAGGVASCAKHYPGHGATRQDSHLALPRVDAPEAVVRERDLEPFAAAVAAGTDAIMTAHVIFDAFGREPATLNPRLIALLRDELGFDGVVCTDALDMAAIRDGWGMGRGAALALAAGVDLICIGNPVGGGYDPAAALAEIVDAIIGAVRSGALRETRLAEAAGRVARLAERAAARRAAFGEPVRRAPGTRSEVGTQIAREALRRTGPLPKLGTRPWLAELRGPDNIAAGRTRPWALVELAARVPGARRVVIETIADLAGLDDEPLVVLLGAQPDGATAELLDAVLDRRPDALVINTGVPRDLRGNVLETAGPGRVEAIAAAEALLA
ncbi:glycoside hydrolase family 3 N-terminal domain-containing protein [Naumannella huperziae]